MREIRWTLTIGFGDKLDGNFEVEDNASDDEIEEQAKQEAFNGVDWSWYDGD